MMSDDIQREYTELQAKVADLRVFL
jgi:hypothetical protein